MKKNAVLLFLISVLALTGALLAISSLKNRQQIGKKAVVSGGTATLSFRPASGNYNVGSVIPVEIWFNINSAFISTLSLRAYYPYSGTTPEISASNLQINPNLVGLTCLIATIAPVNGVMQIDISCLNASLTGYSSSGEVLLGRFNLTVERDTGTNPITLRFDPVLTSIAQKSDAQDILGTTGTAVFQIGTGPTTTPNPLATPTPTAIASPTPTPTLTLTPVPSGVSPNPSTTPSVSICPLKTRGDANCDNLVKINDFFIWRREFLAGTHNQADFNSSGIVDIRDFFAWRRGFLAR